MTSLNLNTSEKRDIEAVLGNLQSAPSHEVSNFTTNFAKGNQVAWSRFLKGAYNHPITWWVGVFHLQMQMGVWGHRYRATSSVKANRLWKITQPLRAEAAGALKGESAPIVRAIVRYNMKHRKADISGRLAGGTFTNYASMGGRFGSRRLSGYTKFGVGATNLGIASYGAAIKAVAEGYRTLDAVIQAALTGRAEKLPKGLNLHVDVSQDQEERAIVDNLTIVLSEVMMLSRVSPGPTPIKQFCARPENINLKGLCQ